MIAQPTSARPPQELADCFLNVIGNHARNGVILHSEACKGFQLNTAEKTPMSWHKN